MYGRYEPFYYCTTVRGLVWLLYCNSPGNNGYRVFHAQVVHRSFLFGGCLTS